MWSPTTLAPPANASKGLSTVTVDNRTCLRGCTACSPSWAVSASSIEVSASALPSSSVELGGEGSTTEIRSGGGRSKFRLRPFFFFFCPVWFVLLLPTAYIRPRCRPANPRRCSASTIRPAPQRPCPKLILPALAPTPRELGPGPCQVHRARIGTFTPLVGRDITLLSTKIPYLNCKPESPFTYAGTRPVPIH